MKRLQVLGICILWATCNAAQADAVGVDVLSQTHHVWGWARAYNPDTGGELLNTYDTTDAIPVNGSASITNPYNGRSSRASSYAGDFLVGQENDGFDDYYVSAGAHAESIYEFTPATDALQMQFTGECYGYFGQFMGFSLVDVTAGVQLDEQTWSSQVDWWSSYSVDPDHLYQLNLGAEGMSWDWGLSSSNLEVTITPEPATLSLLALGGLLIAGRRR